MIRSVLIPDNAQFPQLQVVTDVVLMKGIFQQELPGFAEGRLQIEGLRLRRFRYKPGENCRICYTMRVRDLMTGRKGRQIFNGVVNLSGGLVAESTGTQDAYFEPKFGPPAYFLRKLNMMLWGFPNDPELKDLRRLLDDDVLAERFRKYWSCFRLSPRVKLTGIATKVIKYAPGTRCTLRHELQLEGANNLLVYSKTFTQKKNVERILRTLKQLWDMPACRAGKLMFPEPLFVGEEINALFMRGLEGENADRIIT
jgi:hypothetical protein